MIKCVSGDFFDYEADIRVNTVNCVGVMGAGVALEFKNRYPEMFRSYVKACKNNELAPGHPHLWEEYSLFSHCTIVNLPTKIHWRDPSQYEYIEADLIWLRNFLIDREVVVTLPALGCGHGGLNWNIVKAKIFHYLEDLKAEVLLFEPASSNKKLSTLQYNNSIQMSGITVLYPHKFSNLFVKSVSKSNELYGKGNIDLLNEKRLSIVCSNSPTERELSAIERVVQEDAIRKYIIVLALNNKHHLDLAIRLMSRNIKVILIIPYGILKFKYDLELKEYKDSYFVLSFTAPNQDYTRYSYITSLKYRSEIASAILYTDSCLQNITKDIKILKQFSNLFYINYWPENCMEFSSIGAQKIGISPKTGRPNIKPLLSCLNNNL